jgi:hypothetical protein
MSDDSHMGRLALDLLEELKVDGIGEEVLTGVDEYGWEGGDT